MPPGYDRAGPRMARLGLMVWRGLIMALVVKTNMPAVNTLNQLDANAAQMAKNLEKVSTGMKINSAGDDASNYAISEKMRVQTRSLEQDDMNAQNAISLLSVAEGAVQRTIDIIRGMKEKAIDAANDSNSDEDRAIIQKAIDQAVSQINENANVSYNGITMLNGDYNNAVVAGGTYTHMTNMSLSESTTLDTPLFELLDRSNNEMGIQKDDSITIAWVKNGVTKSVSYSPLTYTDKAIIGSDPSTGLPIFADVTKPHTLKTIMETDSTIADDMEWVDHATHGYQYIGTDESGDVVHTVGGEKGVSIKAKEPGVEGQLAGLTISIRDLHGNERIAANAVLDNFTETIRGQNQSDDNALVFQIGTKANQSIKAGFTDMRAAALGLEALSAVKLAPSVTTTVNNTGSESITVTTQFSPNVSLNVSTQVAANAAINVLDNALSKALNQQTKIGAQSSRLEYTSINITTAAENTQASESVIRDADMAKEQTNYTKMSILTQSAQAMLAQANQNSSQVLSLLQG